MAVREVMPIHIPNQESARRFAVVVAKPIMAAIMTRIQAESGTTDPAEGVVAMPGELVRVFEVLEPELETVTL